MFLKNSDVMLITNVPAYPFNTECVLMSAIVNRSSSTRTVRTSWAMSAADAAEKASATAAASATSGPPFGAVQKCASQLKI